MRDIVAQRSHIGKPRKLHSENSIGKRKSRINTTAFDPNLSVHTNRYLEGLTFRIFLEKWTVGMANFSHETLRTRQNHSRIIQNTEFTLLAMRVDADELGFHVLAGHCESRVDEIADQNVGTIFFTSTLEREVGERGELACANIDFEYVTGFLRHNADNLVAADWNVSEIDF